MNCTECKNEAGKLVKVKQDVELCPQCWFKMTPEDLKVLLSK